MEKLLLRIPVAYHIKKVVEKEFGTPFRISQKKEDTNRVLLALLFLSKEYTRPYISTGSEYYIDIEVSYFLTNQFTIKNITQPNAAAFETHIDQTIRMRLFSYIDSRLVYHYKLKDNLPEDAAAKIPAAKITAVMAEFFEPYGLSIYDVPEHTLRIAYLRYRKKSLHCNIKKFDRIKQ
jgi:hypothetical protein